MATASDNYAAFDRAFSNISAYVIFRDGAPVGRVAFKHGASVQCFAQIWGSEMARGRAGGGGYDRATASAEQAFARMVGDNERPDALAHVEAIKQAMTGPDGERWTTRIERAGYSLQHVFG